MARGNSRLLEEEGRSGEGQEQPTQHEGSSGDSKKTSQSSVARKLTTVVVSAGHSPFGDPGAVIRTPSGEVLKEANEVLRYRDALVGILKDSREMPFVSRVANVTDGYTLRETLKYIKALGENAYDLAVEIHMNRSDVKTASGVECFIAANAPLWIRQTAKRLVVSLSKRSGLRNRGVKLDLASGRGALAWCRELGGKGLLIEIGFLQNPTDREWLLRLS